MKGSTTVSTALNKASNISKRNGKWANKPEIKAKIPKTSNFVDDPQPVLKDLVKKGAIEKKPNFELWRPKDVGLAGLGGKGSRGHRSDRKDDDRDNNDRDRTHRTVRKPHGKTRRRPDSKAEKGLRKTGRIAAVASVASSVGSSVGGRITSFF